MKHPSPQTHPQMLHPMKQRILNAALSVIRTQGYAAATVDDLCAAAGVTKGAFFHHFESKEDLGVSAAHHWSSVTGEFFKSAPYHRHPDPLDRLLGYVDFRGAILQGKLPEFTCLAGTMVQETFETHPVIRDACRASIFGHAATEVEPEITAAKALYAPHADWTPRGLALYTQAVLQGAFILAKADQSAEIAAESVAHLRRYLEFLFDRSHQKKEK